MALLKRLQPIVISWLLVRDSSHGQTSLWGIGKRKLKHALHKLHQITLSAVGTIFIKGDLEL